MFLPRVITFDLDGTLFDTVDDIIQACNHVLVQSGRAALPREVIVRYIGDGTRQLCARAAGLTESDPELDSLVDSFVSYYQQHPVEKTRWMPGAQQCLEELRDMPLAVCTNKARPVADLILQAFGLSRWFAMVLGGGDLSAGKPSPEPLLHIAQQLQCAPQDLVMVGDSHQDVLAGRAAGARTIALSNGYGQRRAILDARPDIIVPSMAQVPEVVRRWRESTVRMKVVARSA